MNIIKLLILVIIFGFGYRFWHKQQTQVAKEQASVTSSNGFISLPSADGVSPTGVTIIAAENCPHEDAQRANRLAEDLQRNGIPVNRSSNVSFTLNNADNSVGERIASVMNGQIPIVFVNGKAKANPSLEQVTAEFNASQH